VVEQNIVRAVPVNAPRDVPVPRAGAEGRPEPTRPQALDEDAGWPAPEPAPRPSYARPDVPVRTPRPPAEPRPFLEPALREPALRAPLPAGLAPTRAMEPPPPPIVPAAEPANEPSAPDAALANMAQRLEAALRRPGAPADAPRPSAPRSEPPLEFAGDLSPSTAPDSAPPQNGDPAPAKPGPTSKSVLDSLEAEMASLLGRPPEKQ
jgi:flagellar protein FliO/FliZ